MMIQAIKLISLWFMRVGKQSHYPFLFLFSTTEKLLRVSVFLFVDSLSRTNPANMRGSADSFTGRCISTFVVVGDSSA